MRRATVFGLVLVAIMTGATLLLVEVALRVYANASDGWLAGRLSADPYDVLVEPMGETGYRPRPGRTFEYANGTAAHSNSMGYRGPELAIPKPAGTTRVLLLGGSTTHGWGVDDDETIDTYMRDALARLHPGRRFEVANLAFDGYDSWQLLQRLRVDGARLEPDFVIVNTGVNDVHHARFADLQDDPDPRTLLWLGELQRLRAEREAGGPSMFTRLKHHFYLFRLPGILRQARGGGPSGPIVAHPDARDYFERNLHRIVALADSIDATLLLSTDPSSLETRYQPSDTSHRGYWLADAAATQEYRDSLDARLRSVADSARAAGLRVAFVPPAAIPPEEYLDDTHLTPAGNRRLAAAFIEALSPFLSDTSRSAAFSD